MSRVEWPREAAMRIDEVIGRHLLYAQENAPCRLIEACDIWLFV